MCFSFFNLCFELRMQSRAESSGSYLKKQVLDPKCAKFYQKYGFWRLVSVFWGWGNPQAGAGGTLEGQAQSQPFKILYKNPLEIPKGIPS